MTYRIGHSQETGDREEQQDAYGNSDPANKMFVNHSGVAGVVTDGMGGLKYGSEAAETAKRAFVASYERKEPNETIPAALRRAILQAHEAVLLFSRRVKAEGHSATTLVAAALHNGALHWISAGDSRAYLVRAAGIFRLTVDHNFATDLDDQVAAGALAKYEAENHPERQAVTSCLGMPATPVTDHSVYPFLLAPGDRILLCTDGLYQALSEKEIAMLCAGGDVQSVCTSLTDAVIRRRIAGQDNCTVMLLEPPSEYAPRRRLMNFLTFTIASSVGTGLAHLINKSDVIGGLL